MLAPLVVEARLTDTELVNVPPFGEMPGAATTTGVGVGSTTPVAASKKRPDTTVFGPETRVKLIFTWPRKFQTRYLPLPEEDKLRSSSRAPVAASRTCTFCTRPFRSQSRA